MKFRIIASIVVLVVLVFAAIVINALRTPSEVGPDGLPVQTEVTQ